MDQTIKKFGIGELQHDGDLLYFLATVRDTMRPIKAARHDSRMTNRPQKGSTGAQMSHFSSNATLLAVGDFPQLLPSGMPSGEPMRFVQFTDVTTDLLKQMSPAMILSPVICNSFDCVDLALRLVEIGYQGKYRVLADGLAKPGMIKDEVRSQATGLDFDFVESMENIAKSTLSAV